MPKYLNPGPENIPDFRYEPETPVRSAKDIARQATALKQWVYDPSGKLWYSPEEFLDKYGRIIKGDQAFFDQCQVRDPFEGIRAGYVRMLDLHNRLEDLTKRVIDYYRNTG